MSIFENTGRWWSTQKAWLEETNDDETFQIKSPDVLHFGCEIPKKFDGIF